MTYRDETEALRARIDYLEKELESAGTSDSKAVETLKKKVASKDQTIREFNQTVASLQADLREATDEAATAKRHAMWSDWWGQAKVAFLFGLGIGTVAFFAYVLLTKHDTPRAGFVVSRHHRSESTNMVCTGSGNSRSCIPVTTPEAWILHVASDDEVSIVEVDHSEWERVALGSWYCLADRDCPRIPPLNDVVEE